eukprot:g322.t1
MSSSSSTPPFDPDGSYYDQSTYQGRFLGFLDVVDPRTLFTSDEELERAQKMLKDFRAGALPAGTTDAQLWEAKKTVDAIMHPALGERINPLCRMSFFVPANIPMVAGMLMMPSTGAQLFWQWANQTYNSALNYANRSGAPMSNEELGKGYGLAVGSACGLAYGLKWAGANGPPLARKLAGKPWAIPYIAVAASGAANVYFTRRSEIERGVPVTDESGAEVGVSQKAAAQGVAQTIASRSLGLPLPVLVLPPILMGALQRMGLSPRLKIPAELFCISLCLTAALPACIAAFPQRLALDVASLEPEFHNLVDAKGQPIQTLYSNKGL